MACITLTSDFGLRDASVAVAKGILMQHVPGLPVIDITHNIQPYNLAQAAYLFGAACGNFPVGTCHLILFDIFSEKTPTLVLASHNGQYILGPDNGIIPMALGTNDIAAWRCFELTKENNFHSWLHAAGAIAARLQHEIPEQLQLPATAMKHIPLRHQPMAGVYDCDVIHIDQYDNVVVNFTRSQYGEIGSGKRMKLQFTQFEEIDYLSTEYNDVREGYKLCRFNSNGYLEICINRDKAATLFGLKPGSQHNKIKITFE